MMNELYKVHSFYRFSLDAFYIVVKRAIQIVADSYKKEKPAEDEEEEKEEKSQEEEEEDLELTPRSLAKRVTELIDSVTFEAFNYTRRGTLEAHKLLVATMLTLRINERKGIVKSDEVAALIKKEVAEDPPN